MDLNDGEYTAILKDKDKNDETKVNELKKLVKKNDN